MVISDNRVDLQSRAGLKLISIECEMDFTEQNAIIIHSSHTIVYAKKYVHSSFYVVLLWLGTNLYYKKIA